MEPRPALGAAEWLGHVAALRRLARGLVRDGDEAEDLVQEVWLRWQHSGGRSRAWLSTVLRNLVRDRARARGRRAASEHAAAREEAVPSGTEIVERLEVAQRLAQELAGLAEPQRLVVHLRYFEDLGPEEIARRLGLPLETVRTRLRRGLAELRLRMDRRHGGERGAWALALGPLARSGAGEAGTPVGTGLPGGMLTAGGMMASKVGIATAAVALAAAGWWLWQRDGRRSVTPTSDVARTQEVRAAIERVLPAAPALEAARERVASVPAALPVSGERTLEGRVILVDERGGEHEQESGTLTVATGTSQADAVIRELPFERGRFQVPLPAGHWIVVGRLLAGGREAVLPEPAPLVPSADELLVRGQWLARGRLRVIDAVTRVELSGIELRCASGWRANPEWTHPGDHPSLESVVQGGTSPIDLPERKWLTPYWVHAPGYAWTRIDFEHRVGGERTVALSSARGTVEVTGGDVLPADVFVRLYPLEAPALVLPSGIPLQRPPLGEIPTWMAAVSVRAERNGPTRIADLAPGRYLATLESGEYEARLRLGAAEVELRDGELARVLVPCDAAQLEVPRTVLGGTLRVPEGLELGDAYLQVERLGGGQPDFSAPLSELSFTSGDRWNLRWNAGPVRTGSYLATVFPYQHRLQIEAERAGGETSVALELPPLVTVEVEVVDALAGAALEPERLQWCDGALPGLTQNTMMRILPSPDGVAFRFVAPEGPIELFATARGYVEASRELLLRAPRAHVRLELERMTGVRLLLREGEAAVPAGFGFWSRVRVEDADGETVLLRSGGNGEAWTLHLPAAGRYELRFPFLEGYLPFEPLVVEVGPGEVVEVIVPAERQP